MQNRNKESTWILFRTSAFYTNPRRNENDTSKLPSTGSETGFASGKNCRRSARTDLESLDYSGTSETLVLSISMETIDCEIDLRPGGIFRTTMQSPEGQDFPNVGCYLEVIPNEKLSWTDALQPGFRPSPDPTHPFGFFTGIITLEAHETGTKYRAIAIHGNETNRKNTRIWVFTKVGESY